MKKIRLVSFLALFLCAVMLLASCGIGKSGSIKDLSFKKVIAKSTAEDPATVAFEKLSIGGTIVDSEYPFFVFLQEDNSRVIYNIEQNKTVLTVAAADSVIKTIDFYTSANRTAYFTVQVTDNTAQKTKYQTALYDASGRSIASVEKIEDPGRTYDLVSFGGKVYRLGDTTEAATLTELTAYSPLIGNIPDINAATEDYYYEYVGRGIDVYDKNLNLLTAYRYEGNYDDVASVVLSNGNIAVQLRYDLPADAKDYSYSEGNNKYLMKTVIVNAKTGAAKEVAFNYYLVGGLSFALEGDNGMLDEEMFTKSIQTIAAIYPISEDGILMNSNVDMMLVAVKDDLSIIGRIDAMVDNQKPSEVVNSVAPGYFTVTLANGTRVLLDDKGKVVGNVSGAENANQSYIIADGKLYNYKLEVVYDYKTAEYELSRVYAHTVILSKDNEGTTEYFLFNGTLNPLDKKDDNLTVSFREHYYWIKDTSDANTVTRYYNDKGEAVLTLEKGATLTAVSVSLDNDFGLYSTIDPETLKPIYYRAVL